METFVFRSRRSRLLTELVPGLALVGWFSFLTVRQAGGYVQNGGWFGLAVLWAILAVCVWTSLGMPERAEISADGLVTLHALRGSESVPVMGITVVAFRTGPFVWRPASVALFHVGGRLVFRSDRRALAQFVAALLRRNRNLQLRGMDFFGSTLSTYQALLRLLGR